MQALLRFAYTWALTQAFVSHSSWLLFATAPPFVHEMVKTGRKLARQGHPTQRRERPLRVALAFEDMIADFRKSDWAAWTSDFWESLPGTTKEVQHMMQSMKKGSLREGRISSQSECPLACFTQRPRKIREPKSSNRRWCYPPLLVSS